MPGLYPEKQADPKLTENLWVSLQCHTTQEQRQQDAKYLGAHEGPRCLIWKKWKSEVRETHVLWAVHLVGPCAEFACLTDAVGR